MTLLINSSFSAFQRTPKEVFASVFELVTEGRSVQDLQTITLVCRAWHDLAVSLPKLWSYLPITMYTSSQKLALWIERSRNHTLDIQAPAPHPEGFIHRVPLAHGEDVQDVMLAVLPRAGILTVDCLKLAKESRRGLEWLEKTETLAFDRMETLRIVFSAEGLPFPPNCTLPRLRSLTLGRGTCRWALRILPITSSTLTTFNLEGVQSSYALTIPQLLTALNSTPKLERLRLDEIEWNDPSPGEDNPLSVALPNLVSLSLTSVDDILDLVRPLKVPQLTELIIGAIEDDLGPVFADFAQKTNSIQKLRTGMWDEEFMAESANGLIELLENTKSLRSLAVGQARIDHTLIQRLTRPTTGDGAEEIWLCPGMVNLELPAKFTSAPEVRTLVQSRAAAGMRLRSLTLVGNVETWDLKGLSPYVRRVKIEEGVEEGDDAD